MSPGFLDGIESEHGLEGDTDLLGPAYLRVTCENGNLLIYADLPGRLFPVKKTHEAIYNEMRQKFDGTRREKLDAALKSCQEFLGRMKTIGTDANAYTEMEILWSVEF